MSTSSAAPRIYRGRSVEELIPTIQAELGADAIVVRRRTGLTGGIGGFFQRPFVEIEARAGTPRIDLYDGHAAAPGPPAALQEERVAAQPPAPGSAYVTAALAALAAVDCHDSMPDAAPEPVAHQPNLHEDQFSAALAAAEAAVAEQGTVRGHTTASRPAAVPGGASTASPEPPVDWPTELPATDPAELRGRMEHARTEHADIAAAEPPEIRPVEPTTIGAGWARASVQRSLLGVGVGQDMIDELIGAAVAHALALAPRLSLARAVHRTLRQRIPVCPPLPAAGATIALVGAGGSGKTTCCAALLGSYRRGSTLPAACATIVQGAAGELAMLLSPHVLEPTAVTAPHARRVLRRAREGGVLLLDMPPSSPADGPAIEALAELLDELAPDRVVVALPATLGARPAVQLLEALRPLRPSALAITHADATDQLGVAVQAACAFGLAPEYLLDRAGSRGGLVPIDPTYLADRLLA